MGTDCIGSCKSKLPYDHDSTYIYIYNVFCLHIKYQAKTLHFFYGKKNILTKKISQFLFLGVADILVLYKTKPEALKSLYRSPGNKKKQLVLCKNYVLRHLGITINIKNTKFVKDLPMIDAQFRFNQCNSFREEYISVFSPYGSVLIL